VKRARSNSLADLYGPLPERSSRKLLELAQFGDSDENVRRLVVFLQLVREIMATQTLDLFLAVRRADGLFDHRQRIAGHEGQTHHEQGYAGLAQAFDLTEEEKVSGTNGTAVALVTIAERAGRPW
jgi:hypothetical protein